MKTYQQKKYSNLMGRFLTVLKHNYELTSELDSLRAIRQRLEADLAYDRVTLKQSQVNIKALENDFTALQNSVDERVRNAVVAADERVAEIAARLDSITTMHGHAQQDLAEIRELHRRAVAEREILRRIVMDALTAKR